MDYLGEGEGGVKGMLPSSQIIGGGAPPPPLPTPMNHRLDMTEILPHFGRKIASSIHPASYIS